VVVEVVVVEVVDVVVTPSIGTVFCAVPGRFVVSLVLT